MRYEVTHRTIYSYQSPVSLCHNLVYQKPAEFPFQEAENFHCSITPNAEYLVERKDFFDNNYLYFSVQKSHHKLVVESNIEITTHAPDWLAVNPSETLAWEKVVEHLKDTNVPIEIKQFSLESEHVYAIPGIKEYALESFTAQRPVMEAVMDLNTRINRDFKFTPGFTEISTPLEDVFTYRKGVCQDFAHFGLACLRSIGLAAKYMSGYIETIPPPGKPKLVGADASHAWIAVYIPELGWVEFDSTNNLLVRDQHIRVASGRDFSDVVPLKGIVYSGGGHSLEVLVDVIRK